MGISHLFRACDVFCTNYPYPISFSRITFWFLHLFTSPEHFQKLNWGVGTDQRSAQHNHGAANITAHGCNDAHARTIISRLLLATPSVSSMFLLAFLSHLHNVSLDVSLSLVCVCVSSDACNRSAAQSSVPHVLNVDNA